MTTNSDNTPQVSVVIPVYCHTADHERYLAETLASVAAQSFGGFELIIVDDVSPVDIMPLVASVEGLPATRVVRNAANMGHAQSRNIGVRAARGELIAFLDHDDLWLPEKLERQVDALRGNPDAEMVFCDSEILGEHPKGLYMDQSTVPERLNALWMVTHNNCVITVSAAMVRRQALLEIGLFDYRYTSCDDFDAWIKIAMRAPIIHLPEKLAKYRLHAHNVNYSIDRRTDNRLLTNLILTYWRTAGLSEKLRILPTLVRKLAGRLVFTLKAMQGTGIAPKK